MLSEERMSSLESEGRRSDGDKLLMMCSSMSVFFTSDPEEIVEIGVNMDA